MRYIKLPDTYTALMYEIVKNGNQQLYTGETKKTLLSIEKLQGNKTKVSNQWGNTVPKYKNKFLLQEEGQRNN